MRPPIDKRAGAMFLFLLALSELSYGLPYHLDRNVEFICRVATRHFNLRYRNDILYYDTRVRTHARTFEQRTFVSWFLDIDFSQYRCAPAIILLIY